MLSFTFSDLENAWNLLKKKGKSVSFSLYFNTGGGGGIFIDQRGRIEFFQILKGNLCFLSCLTGKHF